MQLVCTNCSFKTSDLAKAKEHREKTGHALTTPKGR